MRLHCQVAHVNACCRQACHHPASKAIADPALAAKLADEGAALAEQGQMGEAVVKFQEAIHADPSQAASHEMLAQVLVEHVDNNAPHAKYAPFQPVRTARLHKRNLPAATKTQSTCTHAEHGFLSQGSQSLT